jgi:hypothetical protein
MRIAAEVSLGPEKSISAERFPSHGEPEAKWMIVPDLAVETVSPNDFHEKARAKAMEYPPARLSK